MAVSAPMRSRSSSSMALAVFGHVKFIYSWMMGFSRVHYSMPCAVSVATLSSVANCELRTLYYTLTFVELGIVAPCVVRQLLLDVGPKRSLGDQFAGGVVERTVAGLA